MWFANDRRAAPLYVQAAVWLALILVGLAQGCVVGPDYVPYQAPVPDLWHKDLNGGVFVGHEDLDQWWTILDDATLNGLIARAELGNRDLYAAATRIWQARYQRAIAAGQWFPFLDHTGSFNNTQQSTNALFTFPFLINLNQDQWAAGFDLSWELDLFGRITRMVQSSDANLQASVEAYRDVLVCLYAEVATNYVQARSLQAQLASARENVEIQQKSLELTREGFRGGVAPILDVHQAESNLANTQSDIPPLENALNQAINRIAVLLGEYPGAIHAELEKKSPIPAAPQEVPLTLPINVVRQRPDIRDAERQLAAQTAEIGVAVSDLYPRFALNGTFALQAQYLSRLFESNSWSHVVGPSFIWPVFRARTIRNNIRVNEALLEERIAQYEQTVLVAVEEVNNAIVAYNQERIRRDALQRAVEASKLSVEGVLLLYREGKTNFQNVLDTQRTLFQSQLQLDASEGDVVVNLIALYKALGGGWDPHHHCHRPCIRLSPPGQIETIYTVDEENAEQEQHELEPSEAPPSGEQLPSGATPED